MGRIFGIDIGSGTCISAQLDETGNPVIIPSPDGEFARLSDLYFSADGTVVGGTEAWHLGLADPSSRYVQCAKRFIGSGKPVCTIDGKAYEAWELLAFNFRQQREAIETHTGEAPREIVASVPANWRADQKDELQRAAEAANLTIILCPHEPTAATFGSGAHKRGDGIRTVLDIGRGTTDISISEIRGNIARTVRTNGLPTLGGEDFSSTLNEWLFDQFEAKFGFRPVGEEHAIFRQDAAQKVEHAKRMLSKQGSARIVLRFDNSLFDATITREEYQALTAPLVARVMECARKTLDEAGVKPDDVREFLLVGGQSQDPAFAAAIEREFGRKPWAQSDPLYAVAKGNVILGRLEMEKSGRTVYVGSRALPPLKLSVQDVTVHDIGVAALDQQNKLVQSVIIPRGTAFPSTRVEQFKLVEPGQTGAHIEVLEGLDGASRDECRALGHFDLSGAEAVRDRDHFIEIECRLDKNAMLMATARDPVNGATAEMTIDYRKHRDAGDAEKAA